MTENNENEKVGILFPGQGAQFVGMGEDLCAEFGVARETYERASAALGYDIAEICFKGPSHDLMRTDICQPAILTTSIAAYRALEEVRDGELVPAACAGLSLGEYSALVAAGAIDLERAVELTAARGALMQQACDVNPGTMYSVIGLDAGDVEKICLQLRDGGAAVWTANYNSPSQQVISGGEDAVSEAAELCEQAGARRVIRLDVGGAFHTPLMEPAASGLEARLAETEFRRCRFPVVSNVRARPYGAPGGIRDLLKEQVTRPVRWAQSMEWCRGAGIGTFAEVGPGKVLSGLLRRIDRSLDCTSVLSPQSLRGLQI